MRKNNKLSFKLISALSSCAFGILLTFANGGSIAFAQIAAAALDPSNTPFFMDEYDNTLSHNLNETPSGFAMAPYSSGWKKNSTVFVSGLSNTAKMSYSGVSGNDVSSIKDGKSTATNGMFGSSFLIGPKGFFDLNIMSNKYSTTPLTVSNTTFKKERAVQAYAANGGARFGQVISLGAGFSQSFITQETFNNSTSTGKADILQETYSAGASLRLGLMFIAAGADYVVQTGKSKDADKVESDYVESSILKYYAGIGTSSGHPRAAEQHIELSYLVIPGRKATDNNPKSTEISIPRHDQTTISFSAETIYYDFFIGFGAQLSTFKALDSTLAKEKDLTLNTFSVSFGYMPERGLFFTLGGFSKSGSYEATTTENFSYKQSYSGAGGKVAIGVNF